MTSSRFFVTNLPPDITEKELRALFKDYGPVTLVDLKTKENALEPGQLSVFAFVTLQISNEDAEYYIKELKWKKLRGANIKISIAKESFLERLKRERAENDAGGSVNSGNDLETNETYNHKETKVFPESSQNTRRVFGDDEDLGDDISADLLITKKRAARSIRNGKIVIEESVAAPLHVITKQKKAKHDSAGKNSTAADKKRKESLNKMKSQYEQKKNAIKEALSIGLNKPKSNKIKFSDSEEENDEGKSKSTTNIFDLNGADEEDITDLRLDYGKKGEKLAKLKSQKQTLDSRFKIDEKFVDDDEVAKDDAKSVDSETDERKWQLNILEQVVGHKIDKSSAAEKAARNKKMVRFDPSKTEHQKLLRKKNEDEIKVSEVLEEVEQPKPAPVSQDVFYVVSDTLTEALKTRGDGFSLLNMFGTQNASDELKQREDQLKQLADERILINKQSKDVQTTVRYESSSSGEDDEETPAATNVEKSDGAATTKKPKNKKLKVAVIMEPFFFRKNDERLKEGGNFFQYQNSDQNSVEDYEPVRRKLNALIKKKIIKTKRNQFGAKRKAIRNKKKA